MVQSVEFKALTLSYIPITIFFFFKVWDSQVWDWAHTCDPLGSECWDYRHAPLCSISFINLTRPWKNFLRNAWSLPDTTYYWIRNFRIFSVQPYPIPIILLCCPKKSVNFFCVFFFFFPFPVCVFGKKPYKAPHNLAFAFYCIS